MTTTKTYQYDANHKVVVVDGKVVHSDTEFCTVGQKPDMKFLKACGWNLVRQPVAHDVFGTRIYKN